MGLSAPEEARPRPGSADPFSDRLDVPVAGGTLHVARAGAPPDQAEAVVLAIHGLTSSCMAWRTVARRLAGAPS